MATHTQIGSVTVDAFQWNGGTIAAANLPAWTKNLALQTPGDGTLHIPESPSRGTCRVNIGDWVVRTSNGHIDMMSATTFNILYT